MKILALIQGIYGQRIVDNIGKKAPEGWEIEAYTVPAISEAIVDDEAKYLPEKLPEVNLILHLCEAPQTAQLLPAVVKLSGAKGVIASIDSTAWIPLGLRNQIRRELNNMGVEIVYPEPLCSLDEGSTGFIARQVYTSDVISEFARHFGKPSLKVALDEKNKIKEVTAKRRSPCGSTEYTIGRILGMDAKTAIPTAGLRCLHYPCLASMQFEQTDDGVDTIMHISGKIFNESLAEALRETDS